MDYKFLNKKKQYFFVPQNSLHKIFLDKRQKQLLSQNVQEMTPQLLRYPGFLRTHLKTFPMNHCKT